MTTRPVHVIHLLVRRAIGTCVAFFLTPHDKWLDAAGQPFWTLPTKRSVDDPDAPVIQGTPVDAFVDDVAQHDLGLHAETYCLECEIEPVEVEVISPTRQVLTHYTIYPLDVWVDPVRSETLASQTRGEWQTVDEALSLSTLSPTSKAVLMAVRDREVQLDEAYQVDPAAEFKPGAKRRLLRDVPSRPSMDALARRWFARNTHGVRHLPKRTLDEILNVGDRAFNLRVADPYLRYQMQGLGFTWSFFTHKDQQDCHVHGAPAVEIYGILAGRMEIWWKPYYERGTSAWSHRILEPGDWLEVDSLQCHIIHWLTEGQGVVFKAGPGPLAEVGKLGVKGKTTCNGCPCMKPPQVLQLESGLTDPSHFPARPKSP